MKTLLPFALCAASLFFMPVHAEEGDALRGKMRELEERARTAREQGRPEEANELMQKVQRLRAEKGEGEGPRGDGDKNEMVKSKIDELRKAGKQDEAEQLERRWRGATEKGGDRKEADGDTERRQHVKEAIKHLHAAGLHEPTERIEQMLREQMEKEAGERERRKDAERSGPGTGPREVEEQLRRALREMQEQTQRALRETQEQMAKMARSIEELREQANRPRGEGERRKD